VFIIGRPAGIRWRISLAYRESSDIVITYVDGHNDRLSHALPPLSRARAARYQIANRNRVTCRLGIILDNVASAMANGKIQRSPRQDSGPARARADC